MAKSKTNAPTNQLPKNITMDMLSGYYQLASTAYFTARRRMLLLDAADRGKIWEALRAKLPSYQILTDTNHVAYVKNNLVASIYTVAKSAQILPTTQEDWELCEQLNTILDHVWDVCDVAKYQRRAGDRAALFNLGITQVGWGKQLAGGSYDDFGGDRVVFKNIDPSKFMRDPYSDSLDTAAYCITTDILHKSVFQATEIYRDAFKAATEGAGVMAKGALASEVELLRDRPSASEAITNKDYFRLVTFWVRDGAQIHEIHTLDAKHPLYVKEDIKPSVFPFALLYCNEPAGDLIGTSEPAKIFTNSVAYNLVHSTMVTAEYRNQRPPVFVEESSGINLATFLEHANDADYIYIVRQNAEKAVHYQQFPQPSQFAQAIGGTLNNDIQLVTGVDGRYTGRDTGSVITTGGVESMLDQVTLIDAPKISHYEEYAKRLTQLVLKNLIEFGQKQKYFVKNPQTNVHKVIEVDFPGIGKADSNPIFGYALNISTELPKNKARIAQMANTLMEKQLQYQQTGAQVDLITPEEWLACQDLPQRELMQTRMGIQRTSQYTEKVMEVLTTFSELVRQGASPEDAITATASSLQAKENPMSPVEMPEVGAEQDQMMAQQLGNMPILPQM